MQQKHFEAIARAVLAMKYNPAIQPSPEQHRAIAVQMAHMCQQEYKGAYEFKLALFLKACGVEN